MIKNVASLEIKKEDRVYRIYVENDSPLGEVYDALTQMRAYVFERIKSVQEEESKKPEEKPVEPQVSNE